MSEENLLSPYKVFIIRPWHNEKASLYPHIMDGVEYVDSVISAIKEHFSNLHDLPVQIDIRVDKDVFQPGITIRENLTRELDNADAVIAILDGLRPNVIYELGYVHGNPDFKSDHVVCISEINATVLVRNFYQDPMQTPLVSGHSSTVLNPPLTMHSAFSDNADLLILRYDRLKLNDTLCEVLAKHLAQFPDFKPKVSELDDMDDTEEMKEDNGSFSQLYSEGKYESIISSSKKSKSFSDHKLFALSLMRLGFLHEALQHWQLIEEKFESTECATVPYHQGICYYVIGKYPLAYLCFEKASRSEDSERIERWKQKTMKKLKDVSQNQCDNAEK